MDYSSVKQDIINKKLKRFYIFTGEERFVLVKYIQKIVEVSGKAYKLIDHVYECKTKGASLFSESYCYICYDDKDFMSNESAWNKVEDMLSDSMLILVISNLDKRTKFYKNFVNSIVSFDRLLDVILEKYVRREVALNQENTKYLIHLCEQDAGRLFMELDKFKSCENPDSKFDEFLRDGVLYQPPEDAIFDWTNAILNGNIQKSFALYEECMRIGEPALRLLLVLYTNIKRLLQVQSCEGNVEQVTGLQRWEINLVRDKANKAYSNRELINAMFLIEKLEKGIKTGEIEEDFAVRCAMINILA